MPKMPENGLIQNNSFDVPDEKAGGAITDERKIAELAPEFIQGKNRGFNILEELSDFAVGLFQDLTDFIGFGDRSLDEVQREYKERSTQNIDQVFANYDFQNPEEKEKLWQQAGQLQELYFNELGKSHGKAVNASALSLIQKQVLKSSAGIENSPELLTELISSTDNFIKEYAPALGRNTAVQLGIDSRKTLTAKALEVFANQEKWGDLYTLLEGVDPATQVAFNIERYVPHDQKEYYKKLAREGMEQEGAFRFLDDMAASGLSYQKQLESISQIEDDEHRDSVLALYGSQHRARKKSQKIAEKKQSDAGWRILLELGEDATSADIPLGTSLATRKRMEKYLAGTHRNNKGYQKESRFVQYEILRFSHEDPKKFREYDLFEFFGVLSSDQIEWALKLQENNNDPYAGAVFRLEENLGLHAWKIASGENGRDESQEKSFSDFMMRFKQRISDFEILEDRLATALEKEAIVEDFLAKKKVTSDNGDEKLGALSTYANRDVFEEEHLVDPENETTFHGLKDLLVGREWHLLEIVEDMHRNGVEPTIANVRKALETENNVDVSNTEDINTSMVNEVTSGNENSTIQSLENIQEIVPQETIVPDSPKMMLKNHPNLAGSEKEYTKAEIKEDFQSRVKEELLVEQGYRVTYIEDEQTVLDLRETGKPSYKVVLVDDKNNVVYGPITIKTWLPGEPNLKRHLRFIPGVGLVDDDFKTRRVTGNIQDGFKDTLGRPTRSMMNVPGIGMVNKEYENIQIDSKVETKKPNEQDYLEERHRVKDSSGSSTKDLRFFDLVGNVSRQYWNYLNNENGEKHNRQGYNYYDFWSYVYKVALEKYSAGESVRGEHILSIIDGLVQEKKIPGVTDPQSYVLFFPEFKGKSLQIKEIDEELTPMVGRPTVADIKKRMQDSIKMSQIPTSERSQIISALKGNNLGVTEDAIIEMFALKSEREYSDKSKSYMDILKKIEVREAIVEKNEGSFLGKSGLGYQAKSAYQKGWDINRANSIGYMLMRNKDNKAELEKELDKIENTRSSKFYLNDFWGKNFEYLGKETEPVAKSAAVGLVAGMSAASIAAIIGNAGPQALLPEEVLTVPGAFLSAFGYAYAGALTLDTYEKEAGALFLELRQISKNAGIKFDQETAASLSMGMGLLSASLSLLPNGKKGTNSLKKAMLDKNIIQKILILGTEHLKVAGTQGTKTAFEETTKIISEEIYKIQNEKEQTSIGTESEIFTRVINKTLERVKIYPTEVIKDNAGDFVKKRAF